MANGGTHPDDGDFGGTVSKAPTSVPDRNVVDDETGDTLSAPTRSGLPRREGRLRRMTLGHADDRDTERGRRPGVNDEVETVDALVPQLQKDDVESIVVLLHEGGMSDGWPPGLRKRVDRTHR